MPHVVHLDSQRCQSTWQAMLSSKELLHTSVAQEAASWAHLLLSCRAPASTSEALAVEPFSSSTTGLSVRRPGRLGKISLLKVPTCSRQLPQGRTAASCRATAVAKHPERQQVGHLLNRKHAANRVAGCLSWPPNLGSPSKHCLQRILSSQSQQSLDLPGAGGWLWQWLPQNPRLQAAGEYRIGSQRKMVASTASSAALQAPPAYDDYLQ